MTIRIGLKNARPLLANPRTCLNPKSTSIAGRSFSSKASQNVQSSATKEASKGIGALVAVLAGGAFIGGIPVFCHLNNNRLENSFPRIFNKRQATQIHMVRHGETHRNKAGERISGQEDGEIAQLNDTGRKQADELGQKLNQHFLGKIDAIYTSTLGRTKETAKIIGSHFPNTPIFEDPRLMEFDHGRYDTMSFKLRNEYCQAKYVQMQEEADHNGKTLDRFFKWRLRLSDLIEYTPDMTETPKKGKPENALEVFSRVSEALDEIAANHPGGTALIVTHAGVIKIMCLEAESRKKNDSTPIPMYFESVPGSSILPGNCSVTSFEKRPNQPLSYLSMQVLK